jgi:hypothetical protein
MKQDTDEVPMSGYQQSRMARCCQNIISRDISGRGNIPRTARVLDGPYLHIPHQRPLRFCSWKPQCGSWETEKDQGKVVPVHSDEGNRRSWCEGRELEPKGGDPFDPDRQLCAHQKVWSSHRNTNETLTSVIRQVFYPTGDWDYQASAPANLDKGLFLVIHHMGHRPPRCRLRW